MENNNLQDSSLKKNEHKEIMILSIELNENHKKFLKIYSDSKPEELAYDFCLQNSLDFESLKDLTNEIKNVLKLNKDNKNQINNNLIEKNSMNLGSDELIDKRKNDNLQFKENYFKIERPKIEDLIKESPNIKNDEELNKALFNYDKLKENLNNLIKTKNPNYYTPNNYINPNNKNSILNKSKKKISNKNHNDNYHSIIHKNTFNNSERDIYNKSNKQKINSLNESKVNNQKILTRSQSCNSYLLPTQSSKNKLSKSTIKENNQIKKNSVLENNQLLNMNKSQNKIIRNRPLSSSNSESILNFGERLYHKGIKLKEKSQEKIDKIKNNIENERMENCTFHPKINKSSSHLILNRLNNKLSHNNDDNILNYKNYVENKIEYLKEKHKDENDCTFSPNINKKSKVMDNMINNQLEIDRFEKLYSNYKKQQLNIQNLTNKIYNKKTMFQPKINKYNCAYTNMKFSERQNAYLSKSLERKKLIKDQIENPFDTQTGQKFFSPCINTNYRRDDNYNQQEYLNFLYSDFKKNLLKKKELAKQVQALECPCNESYTNILSNDMFEVQKLNSIKKIFSILDKDQDGIISKYNIYIKGLNNKILKILSPIFEELKEENESLSEKEFIIACMRLYDMLTYTDKKEIINFGIKKKDKNMNVENFSFKPKINKYNVCIYKKEEIIPNSNLSFQYNQKINEI